MVSLKRSNAVLQLGKRLVAQLDVSDDLLASWMAHDIAERMMLAESASPEARAPALDACANAIVELWRHRSMLPQRLRPFGEIEPVLRVLASLDLEGADYRYHAAALRAAAVADVDEGTKEWLELALGVDFTARVIIRYALSNAANRAASNAESWVELAREAGADDGAEGATIRFVLGQDETSPAEREKAKREERAARLEALAEIALRLAATLRTSTGPEEGHPA